MTTSLTASKMQRPFILHRSCNIAPTPSKTPYAVRILAVIMDGTPSSFPLFASLPPELREMVWQESLPKNLGACLFSYTKGCWQPRHLAPSDQGVDLQGGEHNPHYQFCTDMLRPKEFELPTAFVNHEARHVALRWFRRNGLRFQLRDGSYPLAVRFFDPLRDVLFVRDVDWDGFVREQTDRLFEPDLLGRVVMVDIQLQNIAVMEKTLREGKGWDMMYQDYYSVRKLFIIRDDTFHDVDTTQGRGCNERPETYHWCEMEPNPSKEYSWNGSDRNWDFCNEDVEEAREFWGMARKMLVELALQFQEDNTWDFEVYRGRAIIRWKFP